MKINLDAAVSKTEKKGAMGVVCRDSDGVFVGASAVVVDGISNPRTLEAMACQEVMALAADPHLQKFVVASDCSTVVNNFQEDYIGSYSMITDEIKGWMKDFTSVVFKHENRASNSEAHRVARSSVSVNTADFGDFPLLPHLSRRLSPSPPFESQSLSPKPTRSPHQWRCRL
jgi:ribonuclease HI